MLAPQIVVESLIALGFTQQDIEDSTGVSQATISRILNGFHRDPRFSTTEKLNRMFIEAKANTVSLESRAKKNPPSTSR